MVIVDVITVAIIVVWKIYFPRMEAKQEISYTDLEIRQIASIKELPA